MSIKVEGIDENHGEGGLISLSLLLLLLVGAGDSMKQGLQKFPMKNEDISFPLYIFLQYL